MDNTEKFAGYSYFGIQHLSSDNFFVCVPLSQIKKGVQPQ